jgi:hypothetical protein
MDSTQNTEDKLPEPKNYKNITTQIRSEHKNNRFSRINDENYQRNTKPQPPNTPNVLGGGQN